MASPTIQFKRGQASNVGLASFKAGEPGFTTDKYDFYIGLDGNHNNQKFFGSSRYWEREDGSSAAQLKFVDKNGSNSINFQAPNTLTGIGTWILPAYDAGDADEFLKIASASGNQITLDWATVTTTFDIAADSGTTDEVSTGSTITFAGTANEIETTVTDNQIQIGLPTNITVGGNITVTGTVDGRDVADDGDAIDNLVTLTGVSKDSTNLGSFTGSTIADSRTVKSALQDLETSLEQVSGGGSGATSVAVARTDANSTHYITFVDANNSSKTQEDIQTDAGIAYNPSTNLLTLSNLSIAGVAVTAILDEDDLTSDRADALATQQSIKAYVDNNSPASSLDISGDTGTASVSTGATFAFTGTDPVVIAASGAGVTFSISDASTSAKGIASFNSTNFSVTNGAVNLDANIEVTTSIDVPTVEVTNVKAKDGTVSITISDSTGAVDCNNNLTVQGNLYVNGSTTQVNTAQTTIEDQLLELGMVDGSAPSSDLNKDIGVIFNYFTTSAKKASVYWDDSTSRIVVSQEVTESSGVLSSSAFATLEIGSLMLSDAAGTAESVITVSGSDRVLQNIIVDAGTF